jgi:hypothetical protein
VTVQAAAALNEWLFAKLCPGALAPVYSDEKVANRDIRVWHFVIENGY